MRTIILVAVAALLSAACLADNPDVQFGVQIVIDGPGSVDVQPTGTVCSATCTVYVKPRHEIVLTALPDVEGGFRGWDRTACGTQACSFSVDGAQSITAEFFQRGDALWALDAPGVSPPLPHLSVLDDGPSFLLLGQFGASMDLGTGEVTGDFAENLFMATIDGNGIATDVVALGGADTLFTQATAATNGDLLVAGWFEGSADLGDGPRTSGAPASLFLARYAPNGTPVWIQQFDSVEMAVLNHIGVHATSDNGVILRANFLDGSVDLGGGVLDAGPLGESTALARYDAAGTHLWSQTLGDAVSDNIVSALEPNDDILLAGNFAGDLDLNGVTYNSVNDGFVFAARLSGADGTHLVSSTYGGLASIRSIHAGPGDDVLLNAFIDGSADFGNGPLVNEGTIYSPALVRLDGTDFSAVYSNIATGSGGGLFHDVQVLKDDRILAAGFVSGSMSLGEVSLNAKGFSDAVVAQIDGATGEPLLVRTYGGDNTDSGYRIHVLPDGDAVLFGGFRTETDLDGLILQGDQNIRPFMTRLLQASTLD